MKIFIMRHGDAANITGDDSLRPLTEQGDLEAEIMGQWLLHNKTKLLDVFVSPYLRAQQTYNNVSSFLIKANLLVNKPKTLDLITPSGNAQHVHDFLDGLLSESNEADYGEKNSAILFVSHMPFVSYFVAELTDKNQMPIFSTGAIAVIDYETKHMQGQLVDIISPAKLIVK
ncbi:MAG TPA: phosphohistidine phosphatase SixA [Colwellia sp.]|nr:phosphohistidine phosphatase SixA [Colwellia sp.]